MIADAFIFFKYKKKEKLSLYKILQNKLREPSIEILLYKMEKLISQQEGCFKKLSDKSKELLLEMLSTPGFTTEFIVNKNHDISVIYSIFINSAYLVIDEYKNIINQCGKIDFKFCHENLVCFARHICYQDLDIPKHLYNLRQLKDLNILESFAKGVSLKNFVLEEEKEKKAHEDDEMNDYCGSYGWNQNSKYSFLQ